MHKNSTMTGTVEGTGSALNVPIGFIPSFVELINIDGNAGMKQNLGEAKAEKRAAAVFSNPTTNIITAYAGSAAGDSPGFTIGADADVNAAAETIKFIAHR